MSSRLLALAGLLALVTALPAAAENHSEFGVSRTDAAKAAEAGARVKVLKEDNAALQAENAELKAGRDAALKLVEITERISAAQERLTRLAEEERDAWKGKAERLEKEKSRGTLWLRVQAWAATGGLIGTGIMPGIGTAAGVFAGAGAGAIVGLLE